MNNDILEIKSFNGNTYIYNYKYNIIQPKVLYDDKKVEIMAKEYAVESSESQRISSMRRHETIASATTIVYYTEQPFERWLVCRAKPLYKRFYKPRRQLVGKRDK